jgi:hypothetical protein
MPLPPPPPPPPPHPPCLVSSPAFAQYGFVEAVGAKAAVAASTESCAAATTPEPGSDSVGDGDGPGGAGGLCGGVAAAANAAFGGPSSATVADVFDGTAEQAFEVAASPDDLCELLALCGQQYGGGGSGGEVAGTGAGARRWRLRDGGSVPVAAVIAYAKRKREVHPDVWTPEVARALGRLLTLARG